MEAVKAFNCEFYKHVVQSVEKFVQNCKPEYKVPGLYVIDSILRQSRHQFSQEKDMFGPCFSKNIIGTFQNLYRCPSDDKSKIVRVLNLWQKNSVFKSDIVQPLLDMAAGPPPPSLTAVPATSTGLPVNNATPGTPAMPSTPGNVAQSIPDWASLLTNTDTMATVAQILQSPQGQQLQQLVQNLQQQQQKPQPSLLQALDAGLVVQLQALTAQLTAAAAAPAALDPLDQRQSSFSNVPVTHSGPLPCFPEASGPRGDSSRLSPPPGPMVSDSIDSSIFHRLAEQLRQQDLEQLQKQLLERQQTQQQDMDLYDDQDVLEGESFEPEQKAVLDTLSRTWSRSRSRSGSLSSMRNAQRSITDTSPRKRRSRSRSGSRKRKHRKRSRSRSRDHRRKSYSSERQKKGLPLIRSKTLSVCSTTLWVGQVKKATQQDLTNLFEEFGQVESINIIPPRGCAYICMVHRQEAHRARQQLGTGSYKMVSRVIKIH
ncbi:hypothetical protein SKAU_G00189130 [Synaphobranchus kaupii]|uniref:SR-related CTD associated factor 8 n=1 Tax=Synaphobranchus kaupii TaxID=118154 RepID=A0A9Q1FDB9_SYNKA|nr:hypothetical protein SKAU_G00189130 [Synaphobranchus kaupii]